MIIVVVRHKLRPGKYAEARARLSGNADRMMQQPGILFRHTGDGEDGELVTVTGWETDEHRLAWEELKKASPPPGRMTDYYTGVEVLDIRVFDGRSIERPV